MPRSLLCGRVNVAVDWYMALPWLLTLNVGTALGLHAVAAPLLRGQDVLDFVVHPFGSTPAAPHLTPMWAPVALWWCVVALNVLSTASLLAVLLGDPGFVDAPPTAAPSSSPAVFTMVAAGAAPTPLPGGGSGAGLRRVNDADAAAPDGESSALPTGDVHFCKVCRLYVRWYDHHCNLLGGCIGRATMGPFVAFLLATATLGAVGFAAVAWRVVATLRSDALPASLVDAVSAAVRSPELAVHALLAMACAGGGGYCAILGIRFVASVHQGLFSYVRRRQHVRGMMRRFPAMTEPELARALADMRFSVGSVRNFATVARAAWHEWRLVPTLSSEVGARV